MNVSDVIIIAVVIALLVVFGRRAVESFQGKRDCCSGDKKEGGDQFKRVAIADTNEAHYPNQATYRVEGMHCEHCAETVENALDSVGGTWAKVDLSAGTARVLCKKPLDVATYQRVVSEAGYRLVV